MGGGLEIDRALEAAIDRAVSERRPWLPERLGAALARELGLEVPHSVEVRDSKSAAALDLSSFPGDRLVVKLVSAEIAHKSDLGGVVVCAKNTAALSEAVASVRRAGAGAGANAEGVLICEHVEHDLAVGTEILLGARWTDDFGPVAVLGLGGVEVERLTGAGAPPPVLIGPEALGAPLLPADHPLVCLLTEPYRGQPARFDFETLERLLRRLFDFAEAWMSPERAHRIGELEFNPVVPGPEGPIALDALVRVAQAAPAVTTARPLAKIGRLLEPSSIAVAGVSRRLNIGRTILGNILGQGFPQDRLWVVKAGAEEIDGCRCFDSFAALPEPADLAVLAVAAEKLPALVEEIVGGARAESLIVIPGGVGERPGSEAVADRLTEIIAAGRKRPGGGPIVNGGNCLGIRSRPGRYDTLFIPKHKLAIDQGRSVPLALLSQSGAFAVARASKLSALDPRLIVTFGNQIDLTLADHLTYLADEPSLSVFACYVEGFRPLDGRRFLEATSTIRQSGRAVILYRAGRTAAGARAAASHTASIAGSYAVTRELVERAGGIVAESIEAFEDLVRVFCALEGRSAQGIRLGALSNAGFETVAIGDNLDGLELAEPTPETRSKLAAILRAARLDAIVGATNPLDVTPVLGEEAFAEAAAVILDDSGVDLGLIGCVPLTGALDTLPASERHSEDLDGEGSLSRRLIELWQGTEKPWVAVIDGGPLYDPFAQRLEQAGIPTFRSADRALRALARWAEFQAPDRR